MNLNLALILLLNLRRGGSDGNQGGVAQSARSMKKASVVRGRYRPNCFLWISAVTSCTDHLISYVRTVWSVRSLGRSLTPASASLLISSKSICSPSRYRYPFCCKSFLSHRHAAFSEVKNGGFSWIMSRFSALHSMSFATAEYPFLSHHICAQTIHAGSAFFFMVLMHVVHKRIFTLPKCFVCKFGYWRRMVPMCEWLREIIFFAPLPHNSQIRNIVM